jgi:hypothetical protein
MSNTNEINEINNINNINNINDISNIVNNTNNSLELLNRNRNRNRNRIRENSSPYSNNNSNSISNSISNSVYIGNNQENFNLLFQDYLDFSFNYYPPLYQLINYNYSDFYKISTYNMLKLVYKKTYITNYENILNPINDACVISYENFNNNSKVVCIKKCNHIFNFKPFMTWIIKNHTCPICRCNILERSYLIKYILEDNILYLKKNEFKFFISTIMYNTLFYNSDASGNSNITFNLSILTRH